mgnify:CR=1 FL=1
MIVTPAVGQHSLREQNIALVARAVVDAPTAPSRSDVATATGLTRATVSSLVDRLIEARIVAELPPVASRRAGRPAVPLVPARGTLVGIGLEINVGHLAGVVLDLAGGTLASETLLGDFHASDPAVTLGLLGDLTGRLLAAARADHPSLVVAGVQVALPGLVEPGTTTLRVAPNLGWAELAVDTSAVAAHTGDAPITLANEANLAALAQVPWQGRHDDVPDSFLYVSADVGIGAAIVLDRELFVGGRGWSGELGHVVVDPAGPLCPCGATGCLEQYAGTDAVLQAAGLPRDAGVQALLAAGPGSAADDVADRPASAAADAALDRAGHALGATLADFVNLIDVPAVVLGGAYSALADQLAPIVHAELATRVLSAPWSTFSVVRAPVAGAAATVGGARQVLRRVVDDPTAWLG